MAPTTKFWAFIRLVLFVATALSSPLYSEVSARDTGEVNLFEKRASAECDVYFNKKQCASTLCSPGCVHWILTSPEAANLKCTSVTAGSTSVYESVSIANCASDYKGDFVFFEGDDCSGKFTFFTAQNLLFCHPFSFVPKTFYYWDPTLKSRSDDDTRIRSLDSGLETSVKGSDITERADTTVTSLSKSEASHECNIYFNKEPCSPRLCFEGCIHVYIFSPAVEDEGCKKINNHDWLSIGSINIGACDGIYIGEFWFYGSEDCSTGPHTDYVAVSVQEGNCQEFDEWTPLAWSYRKKTVNVRSIDTMASKDVEATVPSHSEKRAQQQCDLYFDESPCSEDLFACDKGCQTFTLQSPTAQNRKCKKIAKNDPDLIAMSIWIEDNCDNGYNGDLWFFDNDNCELGANTKYMFLNPRDWFCQNFENFVPLSFYYLDSGAKVRSTNVTAGEYIEATAAVPAKKVERDTTDISLSEKRADPQCNVYFSEVPCQEQVCFYHYPGGCPHFTLQSPAEGNLKCQKIVNNVGIGWLNVIAANVVDCDSAYGGDFWIFDNDNCEMGAHTRYSFINARDVECHRFPDWTPRSFYYWNTSVKGRSVSATTPFPKEIEAPAVDNTTRENITVTMVPQWTPSATTDAVGSSTTITMVQQWTASRTEDAARESTTVTMVPQWTPPAAAATGFATSSRPHQVPVPAHRD